jgi:hypothetical protein
MIYTNQWAFLHIPKNGGYNFRERALQSRHIIVRGQQYTPKYREDLPNQFPHWHQPISYHIEHIPHLKNLQWICIVRHPEDRLASWYYFIKTRHEPIFKMNFPYGISFEEFVVENRIKDFIADKDFDAEEGLWRVGDLQSKWLNVPDGVNLAHYRLEDQLGELESYVGFKFSDTKHNYTNRPKDSHYTDEMKQITYINYQEDYERFGYE